MSQLIIILVMGEEKWSEAVFLRGQIEAKGYEVKILDMGLTGEPLGVCDITREEVMTTMLQKEQAQT